MCLVRRLSQEAAPGDGFARPTVYAMHGECRAPFGGLHVGLCRLNMYSMIGLCEISISKGSAIESNDAV